MTMQQTIEHKIAAGFAPAHLEVINESHMHSVPPGSESHFKLVIVSDRFRGEARVKRHQAVNKTLAEELGGGIHALSMLTLTPDEWRQREGRVPESPECRGGE
ncbi:MAG: BolA/IbaG family iron-sulfur metabolism protein [Proteobacteria bacterium]|nr:BolA/IbaG family iron-sulfur metabolism protein [Pseudomonadota bacterium]